MQRIIIFFSLTVVVVALPHVAAFSTRSPSTVQISRTAYDVPRTKVSLQQSTEDAIAAAEDTDDVTCFIVNDEEIITEGEKPHVVCTSEPEDVSLFVACVIDEWKTCSFYLFQHAHGFGITPPFVSKTIMMS